MAVAIDTSAITSQTTAQSSITRSITVASNSNRCLYAFVYCTNSVTISSVVFNTSESMTEVFNVAQGSDRLALYRLKNPTATTANVVATFSGDSDSESVLNVISLYNVDQTTSEGTARTDKAGSSGDRRLIGCAGYADGLTIGAAACGTTGSAARTSANVNGIPKYIAAGALSTATGQTSRTPANPSGIMRGDLLIAVCHKENADTVSVSGTGWTLGGNIANDSSQSAAWAWAIYDGSIGDVTFSWSTSNDASARTFAYRDTKADGTPVLALGTKGSGNGTTHTSTGGNTTQNDSLAVYFDLCQANTALGTPGSWTEDGDSGSATGPTRIAYGSQEIPTSGTGSGNISVTGGNARWIQFQLEILHADNGDQTTFNEAEALNNFTTFASAYETGDTYNTLGWDWTTGTTSFYIVGAVGVNPAVSDQNLSVGFLAASGALYTPTLSAAATIAVPKLGPSGALYTPSLAPGGVNLAIGFKAANGALYTPTLVSTATLAVPFLAPSGALYGPSLAAGNANLAIGFLGPSGALYSPTLSPGGVNVSIPHLAKSGGLYAPTLAPGGITAAIAKLGPSGALYAPTLAPGAITAAVPFLAASGALYTPTLVAGGQTAAIPFLGANGALYQLTLEGDGAAESDALYVLLLRRRRRA